MTELPEGLTGSEIAIVGRACRFPGARNAREFWTNLRAGTESIVRYSDEELRAAGVSSAELARSAYVKAGAELADLRGFDAPFFGIGPKDAAITDPQHRHFLELAWEALEDAAHPPSRFAGSIGVFAGCGMNGYFIHNVLGNRDIVASTGLFLLRHTGNDRDFLPTTVSYKLNLTGPSLAIQTACSTSLVAIHTACTSLLANECDMAVAGGITILIPPRHGYVYSENEPFSPDGHCRAFDARAAGTVLSSGGGVVVLRRLADALEDGDQIHAVIRGSAVNNDGARKIGYLAPSVDGQAAVVAEAIAVAGVEADEISYVETHGTGTLVGDPIEVAALTNAFRQSTEKSGFCGIGSNKPNIGHTDTAAGVASVIKVLEALRHRELPPSLHYERPNPGIEFASSPFRVNDRLRPWTSQSGRLIAGVNSLGVGGTNAHVILEEPPGLAPLPEADGFEILPLSARTAGALDAAAANLARRLREADAPALADVAHTLQMGRESFEHRRVLVARDAAEAATLLETPDPRRVFSARAKSGEAPVVFLFPGGGAQYPDMGAGLYAAEPVFRDAVDECLDLLRGITDIDVRGLLYPGAAVTPELRETLAKPSASLPAIFATEYGLAMLWRSWGIEPAAMAGHSMGEYTAACLAGVMSVRDALRMLAVRGRLVDSIADRGRMLSVALPEDELRELLPADLDLGVINGPALCVVSGDGGAIEAFESELRRREVECQRIRMPAAGHCRLLDPILADFRREIRAITLRAPEKPLLSNLTGDWATAEDCQNPEYWVRHLREPVRFSQNLAALLAIGEPVLLEVGPGQTLSSLARQQPKAARAVVASLRHPDDTAPDEQYVRTALGRLWAAGVELDWSKPRGGAPRRRVSLPTYPFEHRDYWIEPTAKAPTGEAERELERVDDVSSWLWRPTWRPAPAPTPAGVGGEKQSWLIFADPNGLGAALAEALEQAGHSVTTVREGDAYYRFSEREHALAPEAGLEGYVELVKDLEAAGRLPDRIAHLWLVTADETARPGSNFFHRCEERGFYSLLYLAQALAAEDVDKPMHLAVVTNGAQAAGDPALRYPEKAAALGATGVLSQELPRLTTQTIDLAPPDLGRRYRAPAERLGLTPELVRRLAADIRPEHADTQLAYRDEQRLARELERVAPAAGDAPPLRERGVYLVTGGLGGLGLVLAEHLARSAHARLVLIGRTPLPPRGAWESWLERHGSSDATAQKLEKLLELERAGAELLIENGDVADLARMQEIVSAARERFGRIDGVFHAAGTIDDAPLSGKTQAGIEAVLTPKIHGTLVLDELLPDVELFALFSSTSSLLSAAGQIDYAAASAFMNAFAESRAARGRGRTLALGWGVWRDVGLAVGTYERLGGGAGGGRPAAHPLLQRRIAESADSVVFARSFRGPEHWIFADHRTARGDALIPGTGYLELARAALAEVDEARAVEIRNAYFVAPCFVADGEEVELRTRLRRAGAGWNVEIESRAAGASEWDLHAEAEVAAYAGAAPAPLPLAEIRARLGAGDSAAAGQWLRTLHERHLAFGPRWRVLRAMAFGRGEALAELALPDAFAADLAEFGLHPALLDLATGFATPLIDGYRGEQLFAPLSYGRVRVFGPTPQRFVAFVRNAQANAIDKETASFDVTLADPNGAVFAEVEGFTLRKLPLDATLERSATRRARAAATRGAHEVGDPNRLSEPERLFRRTYELGIRADEGMRALDLVLASGLSRTVFLSSLELPELVRRVRAAGKVAESARTQFARPELESSYLAPRDEIETTLVRFWQELLGVERIGIADDFFELGGHSLIAVRLFARIKKTWELEYPISMLFEAPTVERCAAILREDLGIELGASQVEPKKQERRARFLVPLQKGDPERPPFFLVAGMFGNVLNLRHIATHLGQDQTVYAIQAKGLLGDDEPHTRFEDMARDYLVELRAAQPNGPYYIGGFSGGGITAMEMARQLLAQDEKVGLLVLLDTMPAETPPLTTARKLRIHAHRLRHQGFDYLRRWVRDRIRWEMERRRARQSAPARDLSPAEFRSERIERAFMEAIAHYRTPVYPGHAVLFRPSHDDWIPIGDGLVMNPENRGQIANAQNRFERHITGGIDVHVVTGDHDAMVLEPHVRGLAARLRSALDEAMGEKRGENGS